MEWADVPAKEVRDEKTGFRATYEYTKTGDLKKVDTPMLHTTYAYDGDRNLTALRTTASMEGMEKLLADNVYRYNKNGQRTEKTTLAGTTKYTYDVLGQLVQENNHIYTYDRAGNRTSVQTDDRREIYSYDRGRLRNRTVERQQDPAGSQTYTYRYDAQGNTLSDGENTYLYDCLNRITEVKTKAGDIQKNHYDAEGLRSQMEENGKLVSFIYADREVITEEDEAGEHIRYIRGHELLASDSERARTYYHYACDEMESITDITDCHGTVLNHYAYDAFGNRTVEEETVENRFGFAGEMMDAVTGQYYLRARFYNPVIARFLSEDTYYGDGLNLYAYCHNNPVGYVDPSGHEGLICSKKYGELKKKEAGGGTLSEIERQQIYEYEQNQKKSSGAGSDSKGGSDSGLTQLKIEDIINTPKGNRPDPSSYLSQKYIDAHLAQFDDGVSVIQTEWAYNQYSKTNGFVGVPDDNSLFVMPKNYCDDVIARANGNISIIEKKLGFPEGYFRDGGGLIRIDAPNTPELNIRIPSGNEAGANKLWIPGGKTSGGVPEAITNTIPLKDTTITRIDVD